MKRLCRGLVYIMPMIINALVKSLNSSQVVVNMCRCVGIDLINTEADTKAWVQQ